MNGIRIQGVKLGVSYYGPDCPVMNGFAVAEIKVNQGGKLYYLSTMKVEDGITIFMTEKSVFEMLRTGETGKTGKEEMKEWDRLLNKAVVNDYSVYNFFEQHHRDSRKKKRNLAYYYLLYILELSRNEAEPYTRATIGRRLDEIEIPMIKDEEKYLEEKQYGIY